jgi:hypothetical protein
MDRAHRIGQRRTVNVYQLVTTDSIEERIMDLQIRKKQMSDAIVNNDNSTMYSMGTDRLLDLFTTHSTSINSIDASESSFGNHVQLLDLDALVDRCSDDYKSLSVESFIDSLGEPIKDKA